MPHIPMWELSPNEADDFAVRYWAASEPRLRQFRDWTGLQVRGGHREDLVAAMAWAITWWISGGEDEQGGEYPMWFSAPTGAEPRPDLFHAPAIRVADALGYLWLGYVDAQLPGLRRGRDDRETLSHNKPSVWLTDHRYRACPSSVGYGALLNIRDDSGPRGGRAAGRDPEFLASSADAWIAGRLDEQPSREAADIPDAHAASCGHHAVDDELARLGLEWPLQAIHIDDEHNAEADPSEGEELSVAFDDVVGHEFDTELDELVEHLGRLPNIAGVDRADREYLIVEIVPGCRAHDMRHIVDQATSEFLRDALARRLGG